jgi:hypothetical protein
VRRCPQVAHAAAIPHEHGAYGATAVVEGKGSAPAWIAREVAFTVLGRPQPAGSKRAFAVRRGGALTGRVAVADANPRAKSWQGEVRAAAVDAFGHDAGPLAGRSS